MDHRFQPLGDLPPLANVCATCPWDRASHEMSVENLLVVLEQWVRGERSHWNSYANISQNSSMDQAMCATADAQEVVKLSAAIQALVAVRSMS